MNPSLLLLCLITFGTAQLRALTTNKAAETPASPSSREALSPGKVSEKSVYRLDSIWTTDVGTEVKLSALRGRPQVMALFYTNCQHSCPLIVKDMKAIEKGLPINVRNKVDFLLVSIDPRRDLPEALRAFREKYALPVERWSLLRGAAKDVKKLADLMAFQYDPVSNPDSNMQFAHSLLITVLNPSGEIVFQQTGTDNPRDEAVAAVLKMVVPRAKPLKSSSTVTSARIETSGR